MSIGKQLGMCVVWGFVGAVSLIIIGGILSQVSMSGYFAWVFGLYGGLFHGMGMM